jgi:hypothetical protein
LRFGSILAGQDAPGLSTMLAQDAGQSARINVGYRNDLVAQQIVIQGLLHAPIAGQQGQITYNQSRGMHLVRLDIIGIAAGVADVGIGQGHDLARVRRVGQDFLIAGHGRIEDDLTDGGPRHADGTPTKQATVGEGKNGGLVHVYAWGWPAHATGRQLGCDKTRGLVVPVRGLGVGKGRGETEC